MIRIVAVFLLALLFGCGDEAPRLRNGETREICVMGWPGTPDATEPAVQLVVDLLESTGRSFPLSARARSVDDADGFRRFVVDVRPQEIPRGEYQLSVRVERASTTLASTSTVIRVE